MTDPASLHNLQDILEPAAVSFWPPAPGIWLLLTLAVLWTGVCLALLLLRRRKNLYRRIAVRELADIRRNMQHEERIQSIMAIADLLKRVALTAFAREKVASLNGQKWLDFLDETIGSNLFSASSGQLLSEMVYQPSGRVQTISETQLKDLFLQAEVWIKKHNSDMPTRQQTSPAELLELGSNVKV